MILSSSRGRVNEIELPRISHDTIGIHTVIDGHGSNIPTPSRSLRKKGNVEGDNDWSSLSTNPRGIRVQHEISIEAESVSGIYDISWRTLLTLIYRLHPKDEIHAYDIGTIFSNAAT